MENKPAVNVINESADKYYQKFSDMPERIKSKASCDMLHSIFKFMVVPAINEARSLDRGSLIEKSTQSLEITDKMIEAANRSFESNDLILMYNDEALRDAIQAALEAKQ